ncbi:MAG: chloride channel protein, partial [Pseudomonadota bacterium]
MDSISQTTRQSWAILRAKGPSQVQFWFIALMIGIAAGLAAVGFRLAVAALQGAIYGTDDIAMLHSWARTLPWYWV